MFFADVSLTGWPPILLNPSHTYHTLLNTPNIAQPVEQDDQESLGLLEAHKRLLYFYPKLTHNGWMYGKKFNNAYITVWTAPTMCLCDSHFCCTFPHFHTASPWTNYLKDRSNAAWYASNPQRAEAYVCHSKERFVMIFFFSSLHLKDRQQGKREKGHSEAALEKIKCWLKWENWGTEGKKESGD